MAIRPASPGSATVAIWFVRAERRYLGYPCRGTGLAIAEAGPAVGNCSVGTEPVCATEPRTSGARTPAEPAPSTCTFTGTVPVIGRGVATRTCGTTTGACITGNPDDPLDSGVAAPVPSASTTDGSSWNVRNVGVGSGGGGGGRDGAE